MPLNCSFNLMGDRCWHYWVSKLLQSYVVQSIVHCWLFHQIFAGQGFSALGLLFSQFLSKGAFVRIVEFKLYFYEKPLYMRQGFVSNIRNTDLNN
jgi:hypothetical protein